MAHGYYYAVIGGYAVNIARAPQILFPTSDLRLPDPSKDEITDKSKADGLTKTIVCFQALWFCVQCILG